MIKQLEEKNIFIVGKNISIFQLGIINSSDLDKIKEWIDPQNYQKIKFECIYLFLDCEKNKDRFTQKCDVNSPIIIIIIIKNDSNF